MQCGIPHTCFNYFNVKNQYWILGKFRAKKHSEHIIITTHRFPIVCILIIYNLVMMYLLPSTEFFNFGSTSCQWTCAVSTGGHTLAVQAEILTILQVQIYIYQTQTLNEENKTKPCIMTCQHQAYCQSELSTGNVLQIQLGLDQHPCNNICIKKKKSRLFQISCPQYPVTAKYSEGWGVF